MKDLYGIEYKLVPVEGSFEMTKAAIKLLQDKDCGNLTVGDIAAAITNAIAISAPFVPPEIEKPSDEDCAAIADEFLANVAVARRGSRTGRAMYNAVTNYAVLKWLRGPKNSLDNPSKV